MAIEMYLQHHRATFGHISGDVCGRIMYRRKVHGEVARAMLFRIDVKDALRQVPVYP